MNSGTVFTFIILIIVAIVIVLKISADHKLHAQDAADNVIGRLSTGSTALRFTATELLEGYGDNTVRHPLAGLLVRVEDSGTLNRRITATRLATMGAFALAVPKKLDDRELYITVEGPSTAIVRTISLKNRPAAGGLARKFAAEVNMRSRQLSVDSPACATDPSSTPPDPEAS